MTWREVARRAIDDLKDFGGRGLLVERFAGLGDKAGVLDGDHGLRSEILQQGDLLFREWPDFLAVDVDRPEHVPIFSQRHAQGSAGTAEIDHRTPCWNIAAPVTIIIL
jgi:hypothetical protein